MVSGSVHDIIKGTSDFAATESNGATIELKKKININKQHGAVHEKLSHQQLVFKPF